MNSKLNKIGIIGGQAIYADTGQDHMQMLQDHIKKLVEDKQPTPGKTMMMRVDYGGKPVVVEINILEDFKL